MNTINRMNIQDKIMTTTIKRSSNITRSYEVNGKTIEESFIYKDGKILLHNRRSWFENVTENFDTSYCGDLIEITLDGEVKRANKLNLNRKDNFLFKIKKDWYLNSGYCLFIHADNFLKSWEELPKKYLADKANTEDGKETFLYGYKVTLKYPAKKYEMYLKYYNKGDVIEDQDKGKSINQCLMIDKNGKPMKDDNGNYIYDENRYYCSRMKTVEITNCIFYNGLYIKEGK